MILDYALALLLRHCDILQIIFSTLLVTFNLLSGRRGASEICISEDPNAEPTSPSESPLFTDNIVKSQDSALCWSGLTSTKERAGCRIQVVECFGH